MPTSEPAGTPSPGVLAVVLGLLFGLAGISTSGLTVALPQLAGDLGVSTSTAAWVISLYAVTLAVSTPLQGRLADAVGVRGPLCAGISLLAVGAIAAALAPNIGLLLAARVLQGIGAAAVPVLATTLISARYDGHARSAALGRLAGAGAVVSALGPLFGGAVEALGSWRWAIAMPAAGLLAVPYIWRSARIPGDGARLDLLGAFAVAVAASGLVLTIQSPSAGRVAALVGVALLVVGVPAVMLRVRSRPDGFLPRSVVTNPVVIRTALSASAIPASWFAMLLGIPLALAARGWTPLTTGLLLVPAAAVGLVSPRLAATLLDRLGPRRTLLVACPTTAVALLVAAAGAWFEITVLLLVAVMLTTVAFGIGQPSMTAAVSGAVPAERRGGALGVATLAFLTGAGIGAASIGGLAARIGIGASLAALVVLPLLGVVLLLTGRRGRVTPLRATAPPPAGPRDRSSRPPNDPSPSGTRRCRAR
ncbi:MAG: MFS transporter [Pseudonocardia sp.]|nr:MFS transporter [Pseudonocardia sp.]